MSDKLIKTIIAVVLAFIAIVGAIIGVDKYFAKDEEVKKNDNLIIERLDMSIIDHRIYEQEQQIQKIENWKRFEQRVEEPELTPFEKDFLKDVQEKLKELKVRKEEGLKRYNELKKK